MALSRPLLWLMATACGVSVANVYYNQPLLGDFSVYFHAPAWQAGMVATASQVGYGSGIFFFLPLGDLLERRRLIVSMVFGCAACLLAVAAAPSLPFLILAQLLVGLSSISAQILIPLGADMVAPEERGRLVGALMSGVLCGILLARVFAGIISDHFGWRVLYIVASVSTVCLGLALRASLPTQSRVLRMTYGGLMRSLCALLRTQPVLRSASWISGLSFASFTAFWTALSFLMADRFHAGASAAGLFGLIGVIGAAGAPAAGTLSDRRGVGFTICFALVLTALAFVVMNFWVTIAALIVGVLLMDLGVQSIQVAAQAEVLSLIPEARSRLNTLYMVARFIGGAGGSAIGALAWSIWKWEGVCIFCFAVNAAALAVQFASARREGPGTEPVAVAPEISSDGQS